jgi:DNA-binding FadR family transcriptional regulator
LGELFGVGRPTIREALRILHVMGLIEINAGIKGSTVKEIDITQYLDTIREHLAFLIRMDAESIQHVWEVRKYVELGIAHSAAKNATPKDLKELECLVRKMEKCGNDIYAYFPIAVDFHQKLALASGNSVFFIIWNMFQDILLRGYMPKLDEFFPEGPGNLLQSNRVLLAAIKSADPVAIEEAMQRHAEEERVIPKNLSSIHGKNPSEGN